MDITVYRVHWLKAKARRDRWAEEVELLRSEMDWTQAYFRAQAHHWEVRRNKVGSKDIQAGDLENGYRGHKCYAYQQEALWLKFADLAAERFGKVKAETGIN